MPDVRRRCHGGGVFVGGWERFCWAWDCPVGSERCRCATCDNPRNRVDLFDSEWAEYGIDWEMKARRDTAFDFWLEFAGQEADQNPKSRRIEGTSAGPNRCGKRLIKKEKATLTSQTGLY